MTAAQTTLAAALADPYAQLYAREGLFGWLHHASRDDVALAAALEDVGGYCTEAVVGLLVGPDGRRAGDALTVGPKAMREFLAYPTTRYYARQAAREYVRECDLPTNADDRPVPRDARACDDADVGRCAGCGDLVWRATFCRTCEVVTDLTPTDDCL